MKTREKIEPGVFTKKFCIAYVIILYAVLSLADIIFIANDHENVTLIRSIIMSATILLSVALIIKSLMKKNICVRSLEQSYKMSITIAIIAVALISIFYFMYCVKSNVNKIKEDYKYVMAKTYFGESAAEKLLDSAAEEARESWYTVWGVMIATSAVAIPLARNIISQNVEEEQETYNNENQEINV